MSSASSITTTVPTTQPITANPAGYTVTAPKKVLDSSDFMTLLSTQMSNQDPLKPMEDTAFVSQMASFTSLAQSQQMSTDITSMRTEQSKATAANYIGKYVTVYDSNSGKNVSGTVTSADTSTDTPTVEVNGSYYKLTAIQSVSTAPTTSTDTSTTTTSG